MNTVPPTWPETPQNNGLFNALPDIAPDSNFIDPSAFNTGALDGQLPGNPQFAQRLQNGAPRNPYQVSPMVPSKRPREDSAGASLSRSQTPAQAQFGFQGNQVGGPQPLQAHSPFPHLQQGGSANATPSPTMQNQQQFRPPGAPPQRMQTMSPAQNPVAPQMNPMNFMQGSPMPQGFGQNFGGQLQVQGVQLPPHLQRTQQDTQRAYQARLQQHMATNNMNMNMMGQQRPQVGPMMGPGIQQPGMQRPMNPQMANQQAQVRHTLESFLKNVHSLNSMNGIPFNPQPVVAGRVINLQQLYSIVMKYKGSKQVTAANQWPMIATYIGLPLQQVPTAAEELRQVYEQNLGPYEATYLMRQRQAQQMKGMDPRQAAQMPQMGAMPGAAVFPPQMSPTKPMPPNAPNNMAVQREYLHQLQKTQAIQQQQMDQATPTKMNSQPPGANGWTTPQPDAKMPQNALQHRKSLSRQLEATPAQGQGPGFPSPSPGPVEKSRESLPPPVARTTNGITKPPDHAYDHGTVYQISSRKLTKTHGGYEVDPLSFMGEEIARNKPVVPYFQEMGVVDVASLSLSLQSGIHSEVRLALDVLVRLSNESGVQFDLEKCGDLIDVLMECGEEQLAALAENNPEVTDILDLTPYEDVVRNCRIELHAVQTIPEYGSPDFELDRSVDRLIAITTILRNLSFFECNHAALSSEPVLKFISNATRLVGTRVLFLRSSVNTADFMKDVITFLSNTSDKIALPSRAEAFNILHFLCAFAPGPNPGQPVRFTPYNPMIHRYLPSAVDSLAKLLARDLPNRMYFQQIFTAEATNDPPYDLLTRAFALAISVSPDRSSRRGGNDKRIAEVRKPYLMQGMLAADILASMAPGPENDKGTNLCRSWLESEDGWAPALLHMAVLLCGNDIRPPPPPPQNSRSRQAQAREEESQGFQYIIHRALSTLKRLGEKSKGSGSVLVKTTGKPTTNGNTRTDEDEKMEDAADADESDDDMVELVGGGSKWLVKADVLPRKEVLLGALLTPNIDQFALRQLCSYGSLDEI